MQLVIVEGDILDQDVEVIVNAWNRNIIPWWLLVPQGVSGAIKRRGGTEPFKEVARAGPMPLGSAMLTSAGTLPFRGIIHVAGINMLWCATRESITKSVQSALEIVNRHRFNSVAFPIIGAGSGSFKEAEALDVMQNTLRDIESNTSVTLVRFKKDR